MNLNTKTFTPLIAESNKHIPDPTKKEVSPQNGNYSLTLLNSLIKGEHSML